MHLCRSVEYISKKVSTLGFGWRAIYIEVNDLTERVDAPDKTRLHKGYTRLH